MTQNAEPVAKRHGRPWHYRSIETDSRSEMVPNSTLTKPELLTFAEGSCTLCIANTSIFAGMKCVTFDFKELHNCLTDASSTRG